VRSQLWTEIAQQRTFLIFYGIWRSYWHVSCILPIIDSSLNPDSLATRVATNLTGARRDNNSHDWNALNSATKNFLGSLIRLLLAVLLVGVLAFLYIMSQPGELRRQPQVSTYLRQLREVDGRWNGDMGTARKDPLGAESGPKDDVLRLQPVLDGLQSETAAMKIRALDVGVAGLLQTFLQKQQMLDKFDQENTALRNELRTIVSQIAAVRQTATQIADSQPPLRVRLAPLDGQLASLSADILRVYEQPDDAVRKAVEMNIATLVQQAEAYPEALRTPLKALAEPIALFLRQEPGLIQAAQQISLLPTTPRVNSMIDTFDREFQALSDEKERYRVYLAFYSAALLVFLGYVVWQLGRSYTKINQANEALKSANETLEQRVQGRTKELSEALKHLKESELLLVQTEKMSSLGQMVAGIAHEINTPLAYVKSSVATLKERVPMAEGAVAECNKLIQMLESGTATDDQLSAQFTAVSSLAKQFQAEAEASGLDALSTDALHGIEQISEIILNLKNFSRLDRSKVSRFNLNEGLESTLIIARNMVKHKTVHRNLAEIPLIECSPSQVNQVFLNLVTNAAQATDEQAGEITVATSVTPNGQVRVDISDNGHGIPDSVMTKIFDPFFTTKDVGEGTGLGLSIAYKIVQQHGGRIEVKSKVGQGTTFSVFLPVKAPQSQAMAA
jgi:two-component system, NtrC family, sensor kinase